MLRRALREPLIHFLLLGGLLFAAYNAFGGSRDRPPETIVVTQGQIEALATGFTRTWQRPPSQSELKGLVDDYVRQEVYARQARVLGLDRDDIVINRRLRQKLEFVTGDVSAQAQPTEAQLRAYLEAHPDAFRAPPRITFSQVFLNRDRHRATLAQDARDVLAQLTRAGADVDPSRFGDATLLERRFEHATVQEIAAQFGQAFATRLGELHLGAWEGPVESDFGVHLVVVRERTAGQMPALVEVRSDVAREWANARREEAASAFYRELLKRYTVSIEAPRQAADVPRQDVERISAPTR
jgi:hypothetical protein